MPLTIIRNDITKMKTDAVVNAANAELQMGEGVCGAIFAAAGAEKLRAACEKLAPISVGEAVVTKGFGLHAKYIVHAAGPVYRGGGFGEEKLLKDCYVNSLDAAKKHKCESVAFPLISSGIFGYPKDGALSAATSAIGGWLAENEMDVYLVVYDKAAFEVSKNLLGEVRAYISDRQATPREGFASSRVFENLHAPRVSETFFKIENISAPQSKKPSSAIPKNEAGYFTKRLDEPFSAALFGLIDAKGKTDVQVYKRANIDRKLFSKIRKGREYVPSKKTAVAFAVALELTLEETEELLRRAGYALSPSVVFDVIVEYFIVRKKYDVYEINNVLFEYDQPLLGG